MAERARWLAALVTASVAPLALATGGPAMGQASGLSVPISSSAVVGPAGAHAGQDARPSGNALARGRGRVVDRDGNPIEGASIRRVDPYLTAGRPVPVATSDRDGRFEIATDLEGNTAIGVTLVVRKQGYASASTGGLFVSGGAVALEDVVLDRGGEIAGRILRPGGEAVLAAAVWAMRESGAGESVPPFATEPARGSGRDDRVRWLDSSVTDPEGSFRLEGLLPGRYRIWASSSDHEAPWARSEPLEVEPGGSIADVMVILDDPRAGDLLEGIVLDPAGEPFPAFLSVRVAGSSRGFELGANGRFSVHAQRSTKGERVPNDLSASDTEERFHAALQLGVAPGTKGIVLRLRPPRRVRVLATDGSGEPLEWFSAETMDDPYQATGFGDRLDRWPGGRLVLARPVPFRIKITAPRRETVIVGPFDPEQLPERIDVALPALAGVHGRVTVRGEPIAGARVTLHRSRVRGRREPFPFHTSPGSRAFATTDADGRFQLDHRETGTICVRVEAGGFAPAEWGPQRVDAERGLRGLSVELGVGGALEGRVLVAEGSPAHGTLVGISRGDGFPRSERAGPDGAFRFEGLTPGRYDVRAIAVAPDANTSSESIDEMEATESPWVCEVREGETTRYDLDLRAPRSARLEGSVRLGGAWVGAEVRFGTAIDLGPTRPPVALVDADGRFAFDVEGTGWRHLRIDAMEKSGATVSLVDSPAIDPGVQRWGVDEEAGRIEGRVTGPREGSLEILVRARPDGVIYAARVRPGPDGAFVVERAPAGEVRVRRLEPDGELGPVVKAVVTPGEAAKVELP